MCHCTRGESCHVHSELCHVHLESACFVLSVVMHKYMYSSRAQYRGATLLYMYTMKLILITTGARRLKRGVAEGAWTLATDTVE